MIQKSSCLICQTISDWEITSWETLTRVPAYLLQAVSITVKLMGCSRSSEHVKGSKRTRKHIALCLHRGGDVTDNQAILQTWLWYIFVIKQDFRNLISEDFIMSAFGFGFSVPFQLVIDKQPVLYIFLSFRNLWKEQKWIHYFFT